MGALISGPLLSKTTLYREPGLCLETPLLGLAALHEMLLQVLGGVVVPFSAAPEAWRHASFENLRAEGAWLVSAVRRGGATIEVRVRNDGPRPSMCRVRLGHGDWKCDVGAMLPQSGGPQLQALLAPGQAARAWATSWAPQVLG